MMASKISFPKLRFKVGIKMPGGISNCSVFSMFNKSSGNPGGNGLILGKLIAKGTPNPGMEGPLGPLGGLIDTSLGLHGIIYFSPGTFSSNGLARGLTSNVFSISSIKRLAHEINDLSRYSGCTVRKS